MSTIGLAWLRQHAYSAVCPTSPPSPSIEAATITWSSQTTASLCASMLPLLEQHGCVIVRRPAPRPEDACCAETEDLVSALNDLGFILRGSHFGRLEDLRTDNQTNKNTDQLGYTDAAVDLHTDQPFIDHPPQYQLLQCIRCATSGGSNYIADSWAVSAHLQATHSRYYNLLTTTPVTFHRRQSAFESIHVSPILQGKQIRYSYFTIAPFQCPLPTCLSGMMPTPTCHVAFAIPTISSNFCFNRAILCFTTTTAWCMLAQHFQDPDGCEVYISIHTLRAMSHQNPELQQPRCSIFHDAECK